MSSDFIYILNWWTVWLLLGITSLPIATRWLAPIWDKGYLASKVISWVAIGYALWLLASIRLIPSNVITLWIILVLWIACNVYVLTRDFHGFRNIFDQYRWQWLGLEAIFLAALTTWSYIRGFQPYIEGLEKFMDYGFVNSSLRTSYFPPADMWFAGESINYYYFGHYLSAIITRLSSIPSAITYNLMIATTFALAFSLSIVVGATLIKNLLNQTKFPSQKHPRLIIIGSLLTAFFLALRGNLHWGAYQLNKLINNCHPWLLEIQGKYNPASENPPNCPDGQSLSWLPDATKGYWYPDATRYIEYTIHEFPIYSFVVADLHAHMINIALVLTFVSGILALFIRKKFTWLEVIPLGLFLGVFYMTNAWDVPIYLMVLGAAILVLIFHKYRFTSTFISTFLGIGVLSALIGYWTIMAPSVTNQETLTVTQIIAQPFSWLLLIGLVAFGVFAYQQLFQNTQLRKTVYTVFMRYGLKTLALVMLALVVTIPFQLNFEQIAKGILPVDARSPLHQLLTLWGWDLFLFSSFSIMLYAIYRQQADKPPLLAKFLKFIPSKRSPINVQIIPYDYLILGLYLIGFFLIIIPEFIYVKDIYIAEYHRANTMFKLVYQSWILFALAGGYVIIRLITLPRQIWKSVFIKALWMIIAAICIWSMGQYTQDAIQSYYGITQKTFEQDAQGNPRQVSTIKPYLGLDGESWLADESPDEYKALQFLKKIPGQPVILEAVGDSYTKFNRFSAYSGLPTVQGWLVHEWLWRGSYDEPGRRAAEVEHIYTATDLQATKPLYEDDPVPPITQVLATYNVEYVIVGEKEREKYGELLNESNFQQLGEVIFESGETRIYKLN